MLLQTEDKITSVENWTWVSWWI